MTIGTKDVITIRHKLYPGRDINTLKSELFDRLQAITRLTYQAYTNPSATCKTDWFGSYGTSKSTIIDDYSKKISDYMKMITKFTFSSSNKYPNSIATSALYNSHKVEGGMSLDKLSKNPLIRLEPGFHSNRYGWGEKTLSILHELTHLTIGTLDKQTQDGSDAYGMNKCIDLKNWKPEDAYRNADNWMYYFNCYHGNTIDRGKDWP